MYHRLKILSILKNNFSRFSCAFLNGGCKAPVSWAAQFRCAHLPPTPPLRLERSSGAAGAFLGLIGLMGLIGQRLTEWQTLFKIAFRGAAPALRFNG